MKISFSFACTCGSEINETWPCPEPDSSDEKNRNGYSPYEDDAVCSECSKRYAVVIKNTYGGASIEVENGNISVAHGIPSYDEEDDWGWGVDVSEHEEKLYTSLSAAEELLRTSSSLKYGFIIQVMIYGHLVAATEGFLFSVFTNTTLKHEDLIRRLVESDPEFSKIKLTMSQIFKQREQIKDTTAKYLKDLIFHNLAKTSEMYLSVLEHDFGDLKWLHMAIQKRHHCAHRAGYDKDGKPIEVTVKEIDDLIFSIQEMAKSVMQSVENVNWKRRVANNFDDELFLF